MRKQAGKHLRGCKTFPYVQRFSSCTVLAQKTDAWSVSRLTEKPCVDMTETYKWIKSSNLPAATEGQVVAAQDQALRTRYYERNILYQDVSPTCRLCSVGLETLEYIVVDYSALAPMNYTDQHNQVVSVIRLDICCHLGFKWRADGTGIILIRLWRRTTSL